MWINRLLDGVLKLKLYNLRHLAAYMNTSVCNILNKCIELDITEHINTVVHRGIKKKKKISTRGKFLEEYKKKILNYINCNKIETLSQLIKDLEKEYYYIKKYDSIWLKKTVSIRATNINKFNELKKKKYSKEWEENDKRLAAQVEPFLLNQKDKTKVKTLFEMFSINESKYYNGRYKQTRKIINKYLNTPKK